ncbi:MAG: excinuclease ABC subunit UvrA, partial [Gemmatales bacterium]|nr:excinuclease ABC subunit UvrA [Gemmatales bacterium]
MDAKKIVIRGAREHNLQNISLEVPRNRLIVFTGVSGSGKSSLAFDTLYAEGQRRYLESLSSYARQFLGQLQKPDVDYLGGLSPSISIQQKTAGRNPRSTVGTITEIYDLLRVLYARIGQGHCPQCGRRVEAQSVDQIVEQMLALPQGSRLLVLAPVIRQQKGEHKDLFAEMRRRGYLRARVDGQLVRLSEDLHLDRQLKHDIEIVIDRIIVEPKARSRIAEAVEQALKLSDGTILVLREAPSSAPKPLEAGEERGDFAEELLLSARYACAHCGLSFDPPSPQMFSFNSPQGMCPACDGLGEKYDFDPLLLVPDPNRSFAQGAVEILGPLNQMGRWRRHIYEGVAKTLGIDLYRPWKKLPAQHRHWLLYGSGEREILFSWRTSGGVWHHVGKWEGIIPQLMSSFKKSPEGPRRLQLQKYMRVVPCPDCHGTRIHAQARAVRVGGKTLPEVCALPIGELAQWLAEDDSCSGGDRLVRHLSPLERHIAAEVLKEIRTRLQFLTNVGLHYLTLDRPAPTLSGGEAQRIRLARQIGSGLVGVLYILDEPSIGLHPRDNARLLASLIQLRDLGNTVIVVEHDEDTIRAADYIVDFGPGPGVRGGRIVACGSLQDICCNPESLTGQYLSGQKAIPIPERRRPPGKQKLKIFGACHNNLKNIDVEIPLGLFVCVTGVSGSGKSSLVNDVLWQALRRHFGRNQDEDEGEADNGFAPSVTVGKHRKITGLQYLDKVIAIDQSPIGRTPRSNPATYTKVFDEIRQLFASLPQSKMRGYKPGRFSFNVPGGRCEACEGHGAKRLEMDFLADIWVPCEVCEGRRFNRETLQIEFKGKNIHDVLNLDVQQALELFAHQPKIHAMLQTLHDVGLDYIKLGQPSPTLSGGEAQRIKLARELCKKATGRTLYIFDEPTTGLHFEDIAKLLRVLHELVDRGNTVLVIEHNLEVLKTADWIIDLGPEAGDAGGYVVCVGPPETIANCPNSYTGQALRQVLGFERKAAAASVSATRPRGRRRVRSADPQPTSGDHAVAQPQTVTEIVVRGAQQHNLKNISVTLPRERMIVFCGPSGSGKTSLAVDTIYAEGQRRYIESLSAYARQFLGGIQKPKVEQITGLSPAVCIEQKNTSKSPRSTVGTVTEIHDYLRVLFARLGQMLCPRCQIPIAPQTVDQIIERLQGLPEGTKLYVLAPVDWRDNETSTALWESIRRAGFLRVRVDGKTYSLDEAPTLDRRRRHEVQVVVDRVIVRAGQRARLADAVEAALELGRGTMLVAFVEETVAEERWRLERFSQLLSCPQCGRGFEPLNPHHFSFNSPLGWCPACEGLGVQQGANL